MEQYARNRKETPKKRQVLMTRFSTLLSVFFSVFVLTLGGIGFSTPPASAASSADGTHATLSLIAERGTIKPGETLTIGIKQVMDPHWHTYWINPGDSGTAARVNWTLPDNFKTGDIQWPIPSKLPTGPLMNFGYSGTAILLQDITAPSSIPDGPFTIKADIDILVCNEVCIPESHSVSLTLNNGAGGHAAEIATARAAMPLEMGWETTLKSRDGELIATITTDNNDAFSDTASIDILPEEWGLIKNTADARASLTNDGLIIHKELGERALSDVPLTKLLVIYNDPQGQRRGVRLSALNENASAIPMGASAAAVLPKIDDITFFQALLLALLGGMILNLMPCVFPILSMKALSLVNMKDKDIDKARKHGLAYTGGVMLSFAVIAAILIALKSAGAEIGWGFQLQNPLMILILSYLLFIIGLNLSGFFEIKGSFTNVGSKLASKGGYSGSFFTGILATLVATPCTAPFMGVAMGFALTLAAPLAIGIFLAMGLGLALPYLLLTFVPALRHMLPHPGHWMETFRQFLAFPMFASAAWLVWVLAQQADVMAVFSALLGMIGIAFVIWLYRVRPTSHKGRIATFILGIATLSFIASTFIFPHPDGMEKDSPAQVLAQQNWEDFTHEKLNALLDDGYPVFINMTAAWCITCKVNEKVALSTDDTRALFADKNIRYLKGDWTNQNPEITKYLAEYGRSGVPIYVYYAPRDEQTGQRPAPVVLPQILTPGIVRDTIFETR